MFQAIVSKSSRSMYTQQKGNKEYTYHFKSVYNAYLQLSEYLQITTRNIKHLHTFQNRKTVSSHCVLIFTKTVS